MTSLDCGSARRLGWGKGDPIVTPVERVRAMAHATQCPECRRFLSDMAAMQRTMSRAAPAPTVPEAFRLQLSRQVAAARRHRASSWKRRVGWLALAAAAALVIRLGSGHGSVERFARAVTERHEELLAQPGIESGDPAVVQSWLAQRIPFHVHVPTFRDARLTGSAVTRIAGRPTAVIRFQVGNQFMLYAITPATDAPGADSAFHRGTIGGTATVSWQAEGLEHLWVGTISTQHLASFAARCAEQARAAMGRTG